MTGIEKIKQPPKAEEKEKDKEKPQAPPPPKKALQKKAAANQNSNKNSNKNNLSFQKSSSANSANLEALDVETEQTLKDINRWLEHTPRFSEFSSASNSPSRYMMDDFDPAITSKLDGPSNTKDDLMPVKLQEAFDELVADNNSSSDSNLPKKDIISELLPVAAAARLNTSPPHSTTSGNSVGSTSVNASSNSSTINAPSIASLSSVAVANTPLLIPPPTTIAPSLTTVTMQNQRTINYATPVTSTSTASHKKTNGQGRQKKVFEGKAAGCFEYQKKR
ncbi:hypothetical protein EVAR_73361_1 [Eumeta japonica]|uniref:Uncharacterized protein n=1 Tax=Eumeta variegata TaxID=151549 RepID=A0A4C1SRB9_EUMVA|nr:hypothetical protein EVAR_73361_1 [Eumeta japonica]